MGQVLGFVEVDADRREMPVQHHPLIGYLRLNA
jgi:hypothetical protein